MLALKERHITSSWTPSLGYNHDILLDGRRKTTYMSVGTVCAQAPLNLSFCREEVRNVAICVILLAKIVSKIIFE
jgi:hypothetical protein